MLTTENSCRSQMTEGLLRDIAGNRFKVFSAGTNPSRVHPNAISVMKEINGDISMHTSDNINKYIGRHIDIAINVCSNAQKDCPMFPEAVSRFHWDIKNLYPRWSLNPTSLKTFRKTRDDIKRHIENFLNTE